MSGGKLGAILVCVIDTMLITCLSAWNALS